MSNSAPNATLHRFRLGRWTIDTLLHEARAGSDIAELGANEVALLLHLRQREAPAARRDILVDVFGYAPRSKSRAVDMAVRRLRGKLEVDPSEPKLLLSGHERERSRRLPHFRGDPTIPSRAAGPSM